jgi:predicted nucleic acid-binding protein
MTMPSARFAMPASDSTPQLLVDTSVAVALVVADHEHHKQTVEAIGDRLIGLAGHAAFETFSVLTRLPPPLRRTPGAVHQLISRDFPGSRFPSAEAAGQLLSRLAPLGIAGGSVYDAMVATAAIEHGLTLATRDRRAIDTYRALDTDLEILG